MTAYERYFRATQCEAKGCTHKATEVLILAGQPFQFCTPHATGVFAGQYAKAKANA